VKSRNIDLSDPIEMQEVIAAIWREVLGSAAPSEIGVKDDFFDLGGTSLSLIKVVTKLSEYVGQEIPTAVVADGATIEALARSCVAELSKRRVA
jgi:acyl carrier protein